MAQSPDLDPVLATTLSFVGALAACPSRLEARVASREGMALLQRVETALAQAAPKPAARELMWLSDQPPAGLHVLRLRAFGPGSELLAETTYEFPA